MLYFKIALAGAFISSIVYTESTSPKILWGWCTAEAGHVEWLAELLCLDSILAILGDFDNPLVAIATRLPNSINNVSFTELELTYV
jgi:hypothetical protein